MISLSQSFPKGCSGIMMYLDAECPLLIRCWQQPDMHKMQRQPFCTIVHLGTEELRIRLTIRIIHSIGAFLSYCGNFGLLCIGHLECGSATGPVLTLIQKDRQNYQTRGNSCNPQPIKVEHTCSCNTSCINLFITVTMHRQQLLYSCFWHMHSF